MTLWMRARISRNYQEEQITRRSNSFFERRDYFKRRDNWFQKNRMGKKIGTIMTE